MRIGLDIDNTICDTDESVVKVINKYGYKFSLDDYKHNNFDNSFLYKHIAEIQENAKLKDNVKEVIDKLREEGNKIYLITYRNDFYGNDYKKITERFLEKNDLIVDGVYYKCTDKSVMCKKLNIDLFIDDKIVHCKEVSNISIDTLIFDSNYNKDASFKRVRNFKEIYNYVKFGDINGR